MKTALIALLLATASASSALAQGTNPYANCIAEASPSFGSTMTIEDLRQYMAAHPDCKTAVAPAMPPLNASQWASQVAYCVLNETESYRTKFVRTYRHVHGHGWSESQSNSDFLALLAQPVIAAAIRMKCGVSAETKPQ